MATDHLDQLVRELRERRKEMDHLIQLLEELQGRRASQEELMKMSSLGVKYLASLPSPDRAEDTPPPEPLPNRGSWTY